MLKWGDVWSGVQEEAEFGYRFGDSEEMNVVFYFCCSHCKCSLFCLLSLVEIDLLLGLVVWRGESLGGGI